MSRSASAILEEMAKADGKVSFLITGSLSNCGPADLYSICRLVADKVKIDDKGDFYNRVSLGYRLTVSQYEKLQRCPAFMKPKEVSLAELDALKALLAEPLVSQTANFELARDNANWTILLDTEADVDRFVSRLRPDAKILLGFTRIRVNRAIFVLLRCKLWTLNCSLLCSYAAANRWRWSRLTNALHAVVFGDAVQSAEYVEFLRLGGAGATDNEYVKEAKAHQILLRGSRMNIFGQDVGVEAIDKLSYISTLIGRCQLNDGEAFAKEMRAREAEVPDYQVPWCPDASMPKLMREEWVARIIAHGVQPELVSWDEWEAYRCINTPAGSSTLSRQKVATLVCDARKKELLLSHEHSALTLDEFAKLIGGGKNQRVKLQGSKRILGELIDKYGIDDIPEKMPVFAFLKWEPAAQRYIYPTDYIATDLSAYMTHAGFGAMCGCSGTDLGHSLTGGLAVKLDVMLTVGAGMCSANVDGAGFNERHSPDDQEQIRGIQVAACKSTTPSTLIDENVKAQEKYTAMKKASVIFVEDPVSKQARRVEVSAKTVFSGEDCTQTVNTGIIGSIGPICARRVVEEHGVPVALLFFKGDDLNSYFRHWIHAVLFILTVEECGVELGKIKDFLEYDASEHERCIVTERGYNGSLFRKIGALTPSEPQGIGKLTLEESIRFAVDAGDALIARGAQKCAAFVILHEVLATYFKMNKSISEFVSALSVLKCAGGLGLCLPEGVKWNLSKAGQRRPLVTRFELKDDGLLGPVGSARLTDSLLRKLEENFKLPPHTLDGHREELISSGLEAGLGAAKYGERRRVSEEELAFATEEEAEAREQRRVAGLEQLRSEALAEREEAMRAKRGLEEMEAGEIRDSDAESEEGDITAAYEAEVQAEATSAAVTLSMAEAVMAEMRSGVLAPSRLDSYNRELMVFIGADTRFPRQRLWHDCVLDRETQGLAVSWAQELFSYLASGTKLRTLVALTPSDYLLRCISRRGYININIAGTICGISGSSVKSKVELRERITAFPADQHEGQLDGAVRSIESEKLRLAYYEDTVECVFWPWASGLSSDVKSLVSRFVLSRLVLKSGQCKFANDRDITPIVRESAMASAIGRVVYERNRTVLHALSY
jgi:hypothetical protein